MGDGDAPGGPGAVGGADDSLPHPIACRSSTAAANLHAARIRGSRACTRVAGGSESAVFILLCPLRRWAYPTDRKRVSRTMVIENNRTKPPPEASRTIGRRNGCNFRHTGPQLNQKLIPSE